MSNSAPMAYLDSSALVKRYTEESGTDLITAIFDRLPHDHLVCSVLSVLEVVSILTRKRNDGRIDRQLFEAAMQELRADAIQGLRLSTTSVDDDLVFASLNFVGKHNLNASDALILGSALALQQTLQGVNETLLFCAADKRLLRAARQEGLAVLDPEQETLMHLQEVLGAR